MELKSILNDTDVLKQKDLGGMLETLEGLPGQCRAAMLLGEKVPLPDLPAAPKQVIVCGMGGSAIGGDLLRIVAGNVSKLQVEVNRSYSLPSFVDENCLVFFVSYSGNTEETLSSYAEARNRGVKRIVATTGGKLAEQARLDGVPLVLVPSGLPPRSAIGYLFLPVLSILQRMGSLPQEENPDGLLEGLHKSSLRLGLGSSWENNPAKQLAARLYGKIPVIYGAAGTTEVAALRWKGQFNENTKCPAYANNFPELNHNEVVGFEAPQNLLQHLEVIMLSDLLDHSRVKARMEITRKILESRVAGCSFYQGEGDSLLTRLFSLIYLGDYASVYLALLYGIDPKPVKVIDYLKGELAALNH